MADSNGTPMCFRQPGLIESVRLTFRAIAEYFSVRFEMAGLESKSVIANVVKAAIGFVVALFCLAAGLLYLSLSLVYVLAEKADWGWGWALLASGVAALVVMASGLLIARNSLKGSWFPATLSELKKDSEWLKQKTQPTV